MKTYNPGTHLGLLLTRITLGLYLTLAGWGKLMSEFNIGFGTFYKGGFSSSSPDWLPVWFGKPYGYALPWLEVLVGAMLILGLLTRFFAAGGFLMLASFTAVKVIGAQNITGIGADEKGIFTPNYIMTAVYFLLIFTGAGALSLDRVFFAKRKSKKDED
ncbi:MAG: DoxX family protein [Phycisphaerales bacterium JB063]